MSLFFSPQESPCSMSGLCQAWNVWTKRGKGTRAAPCRAVCDPCWGFTSTARLELWISAGCCRAGSFPLACQRSRHASLYPAVFSWNFSPENKDLSSSKAEFSPEQSWLGWIIVFTEEMCCNSLAFTTVCAPGAQSVGKLCSEFPPSPLKFFLYKRYTRNW